MVFEFFKIKLISFILGIFFLVVISNVGLSQTEADSIEDIWSSQNYSAEKRFAAYEGYYQLLITSNPLSIVKSSDSHFKLAVKEKSKKEMLLALGNKSEAIILLGQTDKAIRILEKALKIAEKHQDSVAMALNQVNQGVVHFHQGNIKKAVSNYTKSLALFEKKKMRGRQATTLMNLGVIFYDINDFQSSLDYFKKSLALMKKSGTAEKSEFIWYYLGNVYLKIGKSKEALKHARKTLNILQSKNNKITLADCHYLLAKIYQKDGENDKAIKNIEQSLKLSFEIGNELTSTAFKIMQANLTIESNVTRSTIIGEEVLSALHINTKNRTKVSVYNLLYNCYKKLGKTDLSLKMLELYNVYSDSLRIEKNNIDIIRDAIQNEFASKLFENKIKNEKIQANLKLKQLKNVFLIIIVAVVLLFLSFFYYRSKLISNRKQRDQLLQEIEVFKSIDEKSAISHTQEGFRLVRDKIEEVIDRKLNETDWNVLNILLDDPVISNKEIAEKAFMSPDGIGSSLRRMYDFFEIKESKYKKISLLLEAIKISNR